MKKYILIGSVAILATAGVAATVVGTTKKEVAGKPATKKECTIKKECSYKRACTKKLAACY